MDFVTLGSITVEQRARNFAAEFLVVIWVMNSGEDGASGSSLCLTQSANVRLIRPRVHWQVKIALFGRGYLPN